MINNPWEKTENNNKTNDLPNKTDLNKIYYSDVKKIFDIIWDKEIWIAKTIKEEIKKNKYIEFSMIQKLLSKYFLWFFYSVSADKIDKEKLLKLCDLASLYWLYWYESLFRYYATWKIEKKLSKNNIMSLNERISYIEEWSSENNKNPYTSHITNFENIPSIIEKWILCRNYTKELNLPYNSARWRTRKDDFIYSSWTNWTYYWLQEIYWVSWTWVLIKLHWNEWISDFEETIYPWMVSPEEILWIHLWNYKPYIKEIFEILFVQKEIEEGKRIPIIRSNGSKETHHIIIPKATPEVIIYNRKWEKTQTMDFYEFIKDNYNEKWDWKEIYNKYFSEYNFIKEQLSKYKEFDKKYWNKYKDENNKNEKQKRTQDDYQEFFKYKIGNINNCFKLTFEDIFNKNLYSFIKNRFQENQETLNELRIFIAKEIFWEKEVATYLYKQLNS